MFGQLLLFLSRFKFFLADSICFLISFILSSSALSFLPMLIGTVLTILKATNIIQVKKIRKTFLKLGLLDRDPNSRWRDPNPSKEPKRRTTQCHVSEYSSGAHFH